MTIYLTDEPFAETCIAYAAEAPDSRVVLLQDAVYLARRPGLPPRTYVISDDVTRRGLEGSIDAGVKVIGYDGLVAMMETERVVCFL